MWMCKKLWCTAAALTSQTAGAKKRQSRKKWRCQSRRHCVASASWTNWPWFTLNSKEKREREREGEQTHFLSLVIFINIPAPSPSLPLPNCLCLPELIPEQVQILPARARILFQPLRIELFAQFYSPSFPPFPSSSFITLYQPLNHRAETPRTHRQH